MIYVCKEFALNNDSSVAKLLKYLDKTGQDLVIMPRRTEDPSKAGTAQTHVHNVSGTVANVKADGRVISPPPKRKVTNRPEEPKGKSTLVELPSGQLITDWSRNSTMRIKKELAARGLIIQSLIRDGDLGLRSPERTVPIGIILKASYSLSTTRVADKSVKCYALAYTRYELLSYYNLVKSIDADLLFIVEPQGKIQVLSRQHRR